MNDKDRIRLAEAMGLYHNWNDKTLQAIIDNFQPDTDANDDYAVLEWVRKSFNTYEYLMDNQDDIWVNFVAALDKSGDEGHAACYRIGDYARAALKVLDSESENERLQSEIERLTRNTQNRDVDTQGGYDENISVRCYNYLQRIGFDADNLGASCTLEHHWLLKDAADEIQRLRAALERIADNKLPDLPAFPYEHESKRAWRVVQYLQSIAREALHTQNDKLNTHSGDDDG